MIPAVVDELRCRKPCVVCVSLLGFTETERFD